MGDRANIYLIDCDPAFGGAEHGIYLYTHWHGYEWPERLRQALVFGKGRWGDPGYLARIITSRVFMDIHEEEGGGGISTTVSTSPAYPILVVDLVNSQVARARHGGEQNPDAWVALSKFEDYVAKAPRSW